MAENSDKEMRTRLLGVTALAAQYCVTVENAAESESMEFVARMLHLLPKIYLEFTDIVPGRDLRRFKETDVSDSDAVQEAEDGYDHNAELDPYGAVSLEEEDYDADMGYYGSYVDEDYYNSVRRHMGQLLGPDDVFLETFEEDMKYSDTPIAASVSECLADIFQPLYNFISIVKDTEGEQLEGAYRHCHEEFVAYWSQTLVNVLRALNHIYYKN